MGNTSGSPAERRATATAALAAVDRHLSARRRLDVRCRRSHHVAAVYDIGGDLVYRAVTGTRGHGHNDRVSVGHRGDARGRPYADLLDAGDDPLVEDSLPASCECGPRMLSRSALLTSIDQQQRHLLVD